MTVLLTFNKILVQNEVLGIYNLELKLFDSGKKRLCLTRWVWVFLKVERYTAKSAFCF